MGKAFADRWGVPVRAGSAEAVALLDEAIEDLAALAGDPVADAEAAVAAAGEILKRLDETVMGERELRIIDLTLIAAAARAGDDGLARALVTERAARKPTAEAAARQLIAENGGSPDALRW